eukprot:c25932_g1_i3 orf=1-537(-)
MGKNQAYKAMQRAKMASNSAPGGVDEVDNGMMDGSFHSPEWHAARLASLHTSHTVTWEEFKKRQKEESRKREELADNEARLMRAYRAQLDAERASKLARGINHTNKKTSKGRKEDDKKRKRSDKKHRHRSESNSDPEISSDDKRRKSLRKDKHKSKKEKKDKSHKSRRKFSRSSSEVDD